MYDYAKINQNGDKRHYDRMNINIDGTVYQQVYRYTLRVGLSAQKLETKVWNHNLLWKLKTDIFRPLRAKHQQLQNELKDSKRKYDSVLAGLEAGRGNLEREVNQIRKQHTKERAEFHIQRATLENLHSLQDRLQDAGKFNPYCQILENSSRKFSKISIFRVISQAVLLENSSISG